MTRFWRSKVKGQGHSRPSRWWRHPRRRWDIEVHLLVSFLSFRFCLQCFDTLGDANGILSAKTRIIYLSQKVLFHKQVDDVNRGPRGGDRLTQVQPRNGRLNGGDCDGDRRRMSTFDDDVKLSLSSSFS